MKKLIIFLLLVCNLKTFATHFTFGTPGSSASLTSMSGHSMGDTAYIAPGNYTILTLQNLDSIHVMAIDTANQPVFSQQATVSVNRNCEVSYLKFIYGSGSGICWQMSGGKDYHNNYHNLYFYGWSSSVFSKHNNIAYTYGDHTTAISWKDKWHDIIIDSCGQFMQGSFWTNSAATKNSPVDLFVEDTIYKIYDIASSLQGGGSGAGTGIRGAFFELELHDIYVTDRSGRGAVQGGVATGDVGWLYLTAGAAHMYNYYGYGVIGYAQRNTAPLAEIAYPFSPWFYNSGKIGGTQYGLVSIGDADAGSDTVAGQTYVPSDYNWNLSQINQINDTFGYWSPIANMGTTIVHHYVWNIEGINIGENPQRVGAGPNNDKNQLWVALGTWPHMSTDTSHGKYYKYATLASLDSTSILFTNRIGSFPSFKLTNSSPGTLRAAGTTSPLASTTRDLGGSSQRTIPDLDYLQLNSSGNFTYTLGSACNTSAGIYNTSGVLIRTIWSVKPESAGIKSGYWDGNDDFGNTASGEPFSFKVLSSNVSYNWNGVIGNSSLVDTGVSTFGYLYGDGTTGGGAVAAGSNIYWASGYSEGRPSRWRTTASNINTRSAFIGPDNNNFTNEFVATDGTNVYWAFYDPFATANSGVYATTVSSDAAVSFSSGTTYKGWSCFGFNGAGSIPNYEITGLAVQKTHNYAVITRSRLNQVLTINKTTGTTAQTYSVTSAGRCVVDGSDNVWISDNLTVKQYSVDGSGHLTYTGVNIGIASVGGLDVSPNGTKIAICDLAAAQVKQYTTASGSFVNSLGTGVSYKSSPTVANNKFYWGNSADTTGSYYFTFVTYLSDSSILIGDRQNSRVQHFASDFSTFLGSQSYISRGYSVAVDNNNASRVFDKTLEYSIDYTKPVGSCWTLVNNWGGKYPGNFDALDQLMQPVTLSNGHTYTFIRGGFTFYLVELVSGYGIRFTGITKSSGQGFSIDPSTGDFINLTKTGSTIGSVFTYKRYARSGFDGSNNPIWSGSSSNTSLPATTVNTPYPTGYPFNSNIVKTNLGNIIVFGNEHSDTTVGTSSGYHLGSIAEGGSTYRTLSMPGTDGKTYKGPFPGQGQSPINGGWFDNGNGVNYAGAVFGIYKDNIVLGYHGEFWKNTQTNYFFHYDDSTGLLIGEFGKSWYDYPTAAAGGANLSPEKVDGNALTGTLVKGSDSVVYLYAAEENIHDGVQRWSITGLTSVSHQTGTFIGGSAPSTPGDLLSGFTRGTTNFPDGTAGWRRSISDFSTGTHHLTTKTGSRSYDIAQSTDLYVEHQTNAAGDDISFTRGLITPGTHSSNWQTSFDVLWDNNVFNNHSGPPYTGGAYLDVLDSAGKVICELHLATNFGGTDWIVMNGSDIYTDGSNLSIYRLSVKFNNVSFKYLNGTLTMMYGNVSTSVSTPFQVGADMTQPYNLRLHIFETDSGGIYAIGHSIAIQNAYFTQNFTNPGQYFIRHAGKLYFK